MRRAFLISICLLAACKEKSTAAPIDAPPAKAPPLGESEFRARASLSVSEQGGVFVVTDGAGLLKLTLPGKPTLSGAAVAQSGVEVFNAQAVMPGGDVDVQFGAATVRDGEMPQGMVDSIAGAPNELAKAAGGTVTKNEMGTLAGSAARVFELTTGDGRRLFGWYVVSAAHARMYQLNCVGIDTPKSRVACETIAGSLGFTP